MNQEPVIAVGLIENTPEITLELLNEYKDRAGNCYPTGTYTFTCKKNKLLCSRDQNKTYDLLELSADDAACFRTAVTIGINFHWQQKKKHTFRGAIKMLPLGDDTVTLINLVPLETYILSVSCSEMSATSPEEFLKAHSIISRSWLLAQLNAKDTAEQPVPDTDPDAQEIIRWYDRQSHTEFDVCADDHCQRYQGTDMITSGSVAQAVNATRGEVLMFDGKPCDARFSKCCGGVTEDFRLAWGETPVPYLIPFADTEQRTLPEPPLTDEQAAGIFLTGNPDAYCNCADDSVLSSVLNSYDQSTKDFYRWQIRLSPDDIAGFLRKKQSLDLGRILALEPVERGLSGRLKKLKIVGDRRTVTIGKELEIRRALSATHLYSSAFVVETEGPRELPDMFILHGAGWGHGVGLCQIGAAVMASRGFDYKEILSHYYPGSNLDTLYT